MITYSLFSNHPKIVRIPAGAPLFTEGDEAGAMFVLVAGRAEIVVRSRTVEQLVPGGVVGEMSLLDHAPRSASVVATTDCEFVEIDESKFHSLVAQTPYFATEVMQMMALRLRRTDQLIPPIQTAAAPPAFPVAAPSAQ